MTPGEVGKLLAAERAAAGQTPMRAEGLRASADGGSNLPI
jgi:hypothetical protein